MRLLRSGLTIVALIASATLADAQGTRCSAFLHLHDGSWKSFVEDQMLLPSGPRPIHPGEHFSRGAGGDRGLIARILDAQCQPDSPY